MRKTLSIVAIVIALVASSPAAYANCQTLEFITEGLPTFIQGEEYNFQIEVYGGTPGYTFSLWQGTMPTGLRLTSAGFIEGTPDGDPSDSTIWVRVTDSQNCTRTQAFAIRVEAP